MTKVGALLKKKGIKQKDAAKVLRISESAFSLKCNGWCTFKQNEIAKLREEYGFTEEEIMQTFF